MGGERHPKFAEDRGEAGWGSWAGTFLSDLWKVAYLGNSLSPSQSTRPESKQWASAEVELMLGVIVRYKRLRWVNANHSAWDVDEGSCAESGEQCQPWRGQPQPSWYCSA